MAGVTRLSPPVEAEHHPARRQKSRVHVGTSKRARQAFIPGLLSCHPSPAGSAKPDSSL